MCLYVCMCQHVFTALYVCLHLCVSCIFSHVGRDLYLHVFVTQNTHMFTCINSKLQCTGLFRHCLYVFYVVTFVSQRFYHFITFPAAKISSKFTIFFVFYH